MRPGSKLLTEESLAVMLENAKQSIKVLSQLPLECILYACTSGSFIGAEESPYALQEALAEYTHIPIITTSVAVIEALQALPNAARVFLLSPYPLPIHQAEIHFLEAQGFKVAADVTLACDDKYTIGSVDSQQIVDRLVASKDAIDKLDVVFISCTNLLTFSELVSLEKAFNKPIISSNLAGLWAICQQMDITLRGEIAQLQLMRQKVKIK